MLSEKYVMRIKVKPYIIVGFIFVIGVIFHFVMANFSKTIGTYPDELRYMCIAKNISAERK